MEKEHIVKKSSISPKTKSIALVIFLAISVPFFLYQLKVVRSNNKNSESQGFTIIAATPVDQVFSYETIGKPTIRFSKRIDPSEHDLNQYFSISPPISGAKWNLEDRGQTVTYGYSKQQAVVQTIPNTTYTISIKKTLKSFDGESLPEGITTTFSIK